MQPLTFGGDYHSAELIRKCVSALDSQLRVTPLQYTVQVGVQNDGLTDGQLRSGEPKTEWDFKTKHDFYTHMESQDLRTLQSEKVKSYEELQIANWLFEILASNARPSSFVTELKKDPAYGIVALPAWSWRNTAAANAVGDCWASPGRMVASGTRYIVVGHDKLREPMEQIITAFKRRGLI